MHIPKQLKIGGHNIKVEICDLPSDRDGDFSSTTNTIRLEKKMTKSRQEATLIHEVFHVLNAVLGETHLGHMLLDSLSEQFYQVLSDNKLLK